MREDDAFDAPLTDVGIKQAKGLSSANRRSISKTDTLPEIDLIVSSPLSRAIDTAMLVFPKKCEEVPFICNENIRERNGWLLNAKRMKSSELTKKYPGVDFSYLETEEDVLWDEKELESAGDCAERGRKTLDFIWERRATNKHVVLAAHGGIFHALFNEHPLVHADEGMKRRFENCDVRACEVTVRENNNEDSKETIFDLKWCPKAEVKL
jgi:broad specificity phosphatase PhoE